MASTESLVTAVNATAWNGFMSDDGAVTRIRDGQLALLTAFGNLSIPAGATIDGIQIIMEGYASPADLDGNVGNWISVSNDGGSTFSTAQSEATGDWSSNSGMLEIETAGGLTDLWGMTWNTTTAAAIQVRMGWGTTTGDAVYMDYVKVRIYYTTTTTYPSDEQMHIKEGVIELKNGKMEFK